MAATEENKKTLLRVSIADGVLEDNLAKHLGWVYDPSVYDTSFKRKPENYGLHANRPK